MQTSDSHNTSQHSDAYGSQASESLRSIAYSMDLLIPGLYLWLRNFVLKIGGAKPDDKTCRYPGTIHSPVGIALVLPGYRIFSGVAAVAFAIALPCGHYHELG